MFLTKPKLKMGLKSFFYVWLAGGLYRIRSIAPARKNRVLIVEVTREEPSHNFDCLIPALKARGVACDFFSWGKFRVSTPQLFARTLQLAWKIASVNVVFVCQACPPVGCLPVRANEQVVQLWHGCGAFKKFGMSTASKIFGASAEEKELFPEHRTTTLVTVSSPEVCWAYAEAMDLGDKPEVVQPLGVSRTDVFFDEQRIAQWREQVREVVPAVDGKKVLLWAPTFRGQLEAAEAPDTLDVGQLHEALGDEWVVLVKHHPNVRERPAIPASCSAAVFDISTSLSIEAAMVAADVLVTDYSSLVFEWSLLDRPVAFLAPDRDEYDDWRGFYYDYDELAPGPVLTTTGEVASWIQSLPSSFDRERLANFRERFMAACDGKATDRIVRAVLGEDSHVA